MHVTIDVSDKVAARAQAEGLSVERFAQQAVEEAAEPKPKFALETPGVRPIYARRGWPKHPAASQS
ncbi:hypothetical protein ACPOL_2170 [Acidisarcina polymorpha]|uniref:Uncharacterized protein n=1 Tax=Acidisarcina polymorpha TaxID=2211140 RepID=A0A2Z5FYA0_9BACT|nr:hypothetical protein ACPOL_2170 [Acidisarcina polymorpha]